MVPLRQHRTAVSVHQTNKPPFGGRPDPGEERAAQPGGAHAPCDGAGPCRTRLILNQSQAGRDPEVTVAGRIGPSTTRTSRKAVTARTDPAPASAAISALRPPGVETRVLAIPHIPATAGCERSPLRLVSDDLEVFGVDNEAAALVLIELCRQPH